MSEQPHAGVGSSDAGSLSGTIAHIDRHVEDTGWCVMRVTAHGHRRQVKVVGITPHAKPGEFVEATGRWDEYAGQSQFRATELRILAPRTTDGIVRLLGSGIVKGIGKSFAKKLGAHFGESLPEVIREKPHLLEKVAGIGRGRRVQIEAAWASISEECKELIFLNSQDITGALATRLYRAYGKLTGEIVRREPYRLIAEIDGVGFDTADRIAAKVGIAVDSPVRLRAGVLHALHVLTQKGHCAANHAELLAKTAKELSVPESLVVTAIEQCVRDGTLVMEPTEDGVLYFLPKLQQAEERVASQIARLVTANREPWPIFDIEAAIAWVQERESIRFSASQAEALRVVLSSPSRCAIVTGGPGTGKSTLLRGVLRILEAKKQEIRLAAPTGRAARRMTEATGRPAQTLHRLLGFDGQTRRFVHNASYPIPADLVAVDEFSMAGVSLTATLLQALHDGAGLLILGDSDQLPSIDPGSVLSDLIRSGAIPVIHLTEIFRQSEGSAIVTNAQLINQGLPPLNLETPDLASDFAFLSVTESESIQQTIFDLVTAELPALGFDPRRDIQVLTPMHRGLLGTRDLNRGLQQLLRTSDICHTRGDTVFRVGDKVIQTKNDTERDVANGDIGFVTGIDGGERRLYVEFDARRVSYRFAQLDELSLAWAASVHKAQGSEWPVVIMPVSMEHSVLLDRRLLYTAVTRARRKVILVGQRHALSLAVGNARSYDRVTRLAERIRSKAGQRDMDHATRIE